MPFLAFLFMMSLAEAANWATIAGAVGIVLAVISLYITRNTFHQNVIASCANRFQKLAPKLANPKPSTVQKYLELCNEELFYFEAGYLPQPVVDEWVEGMLGCIGFWRGGQMLTLFESLTPSRLAIDWKTQLGSYPRLQYAFTLADSGQQRIIAARQWDVSNEDKDAAARAQAVLEVLRNLSCYQKQSFFRHLRRVRHWQLGGAS